ncbi:MAG TPA: hypothetical protein VMZ71_08340 [Gemmataceae bacterium]|nr:hypothetical protein [Gemmataceae bacterium]
MPDVAEKQLDLRLVPAEGPPDPQVLDDIIRLIKQAVVTLPKDAPQLAAEGELRPPTPDEQPEVNAAEAKIKHRIEQASRESQAFVEKRAETAVQPDGEQKLAEESLKAARRVVSAVQRAILRGVAVRVPEPPQPNTGE